MLPLLRLSITWHWNDDWNINVTIFLEDGRAVLVGCFIHFRVDAVSAPVNDGAQPAFCIGRNATYRLKQEDSAISTLRFRKRINNPVTKTLVGQKDVKHAARTTVETKWGTYMSVARIFNLGARSD
jgi:hypothetical protein